MLTDLILDHLYPSLGVVLSPIWALGAAAAILWLPRLRGRGAVALLVCLAGLYGLSASAGIWRGPGVEWLVSVRGVQLRAQWAGVAALLMVGGLGLPPLTRTPWRSAVALPLLMGQGAAALASGVIIAGVGLLEPGRPRRGLLLLGLGGLLGGWLAQTWSLPLWIQAGRYFSADAASVIVDLGEQLLRAVGWAGLLAWALLPPPPGEPAAPSMANYSASPRSTGESP